MMFVIISWCPIICSSIHFESWVLVMEDSSSSAFEDVFVSIPSGGPVFVSDMVGPLTRVPHFQSCVQHELQDLMKELRLDVPQQNHHDISVDELKILSEEDLVDLAFQATLKGGNLERDPSLSSEECSNRTMNDSETLDVDLECSVKSGVDEDYVPPNDFPRRSKRITNNGKMNKNVSKKSGENVSETLDVDLKCTVKSGMDEDYVPTNDLPRSSKRTTSNGKLNRNVSKKNKRVTQKDKTHEEDYMVEVEKIAKIKQKQEEDISAARLHSFSGTSGAVSCVIPPDKKEQLSSFNFTSFSTKVKSSNTREHIPLHGSEILLCIEVYYMNRRLVWVKSQEIMVLGNQLLTELRDKIYCLTDEIMKLDEKHDPSGYFLIEDIFYNDLREAGSADYSKPILDWLKESKKVATEKWECITSGELQQKQKEVIGSGSGPKMPQLTARPMQETRFCDLKFRLGAGYSYCHQGDCKHLIVIRDMRLIHPEDVQNRAAYPLIMFQSKLRFQKCSCCKIFRATKVTVDDKHAPENPCYFCGICYYLLHYANNELLYDDFQVFNYIHD